MSTYTSNLRYANESRGYSSETNSADETGKHVYTDPGRDTSDRPREYTSDPIVVIAHPGAETHSGDGYVNGSGVDIVRGDYVYAKSGNTVFFFDDNAGKKQVGPAGGKGGQANSPSRSGTGDVNEFVGVFTGNATKQFIQVDWVNQWWQNGSLFKKGTTKSESKTSWVKISAVSWQKEFISPSTPNIAPPPDDNLPGKTSSGIDPMTLGVAAIGAALIFKKKKKGKK
ncbi:hypothetical protein [Dyadobacter sp. LHD-138]|uniref:hypothetical protein n=1 Tax=Dyadobacter sp. LHD-138 TaxID=3071413 RepID=UPI0027DFBD0C|nr:hypothetical protein [Dyadobacter sp. LHD-138]MDQ6482349.1 hypothetical protein [Dyadobacter sp. LHD-138]